MTRWLIAGPIDDSMSAVERGGHEECRKDGWALLAGDGMASR